MHHFYVNKNSDSNTVHEVHIDKCPKLPEANEREYVGYFSDCQEAIVKAQTKYEYVNGCPVCNSDCFSKISNQFQVN